MDDDLTYLDRDALIAEVKRLRDAIRQHRDSNAHELCWHHPQLWGLLPEATDPLPVVPDWPQFMRGCIAYRLSLDRQLPDAPRTSGEYDEAVAPAVPARPAQVGRVGTTGPTERPTSRAATDS
jgi:hypothetical protein